MREYRRLSFRRVALNRVRNLETRLSCIRQQNTLKRLENAAAVREPRPAPVAQPEPA